MFVMHGKLTASGSDLAADKAARNSRRGMGGADPAISPRRLGWPRLGFWGLWQGERRSARTDSSWGIWHIARGRGGPIRQGRASPLHLVPKTKLDILINFCSYLHLHLLVL